jgi:Holliday junction resolvase RusA-like endonuclease
MPGLNEIITASKTELYYLRRGKRRVYKYTKMKSHWHEVIFHNIKMQHKGVLPMFNDCNMSFHWYEKSRRRDPSNVCAGGRKFILDALVEMKILKNDNWLVRHFEDRFIILKDYPHVEVFISAL